MHDYRTVYFDTKAFDLYHAHVTGRPQIYKVRSREYTDTRLAFLEVKHKTQKLRTEKSRLPIEDEGEALDVNVESFCRILHPTPAAIFSQNSEHLQAHYLVDLIDQERLTLDVDLTFFNEEHSFSLEGIAVAEGQKHMLTAIRPSPAWCAAWDTPHRVSASIAFGVSQLYPSVKKNSRKNGALDP